MSDSAGIEKHSISEAAWELYYDRFFPFRLIVEWLTHNKQHGSLAKRELSLAVSKGQEEFYIRWQSYADDTHLKRKLLSMDTLPHKIDIGAVYNMPVSERANASTRAGGPMAFFPVEKELVFDIDMNDYDDVRRCCRDKVVCAKCWRFLALAADVLEVALREDFGFRHIFWVFSGRRGIHGWVCDPEARRLSSDARMAIVDYLNLVTGSSNQKKKVRLYSNTLHPMVQRAYERSLKHFYVLLVEQNFFNGKDGHLLSLVDDYMAGCPEDIRSTYQQRKLTAWDGTSKGLWELILGCCLPRDKVTPVEILLSVCYPRLDINVSKDLGHLLKAPFSVHKATGKVCIPLPPSERFDFDPAQTPHIEDLRAQFLKAVREGKEGNVEVTDLQRYIKYFHEAIVAPLISEGATSLSPIPQPEKNISLAHEDEELQEQQLLLSYTTSDSHKNSEDSAFFFAPAKQATSANSGLDW